MESICKIVKATLWCIVFALSFKCLGQNIYNSRTIYYNMDTLRCVDKDVRFWEGDKIIPYAGNPDSSTLYCISKGTIEIPIVRVNDDKITLLIDSCLINATKGSYLQFPDSSGYFVELHIFETKEDSLMMGIVATPYSNYYMADVLLSFRNDTFYEWYGYKEKDLHGCFFRNNILCVISSQGWLDYERIACFFSQTESKITLALFCPLVHAVHDHIQAGSYCYFRDCNTKWKGD